MSKKKRKKKAAAPQLSVRKLRQLERLEDLVMDAEDAQDDAEEAAKACKRLLRSAPDEIRGGLEKDLLGPLEQAVVAFDRLIDCLNDTLEEARKP